MEPVTVNGRMLRALARNDGAAIRRWQAEMKRDDYAQDTADLFAWHACAGLLALRAKARFGALEIARLHRLLRLRGFEFQMREVDRVLTATSGDDASVAGVPGPQALKIRIGLFPLLVGELGLSAGQLDDVLVTAERQVCAERQESYPPQ